MTDLSQDAVPQAMPVLDRGKHRNPSRGACFMEYTALLAGEPFSHAPRCVDEELAAVMRGANDKLSDDDRRRLTPLLGRAIGLAVERPDGTVWCRSADARRRYRADRGRYRAETTRLRGAVSRLFTAAVGCSPAPSAWAPRGFGNEVSWLFWDLMEEPTVLGTSEEYVERLLERLHLLHSCYEQAMDELGVPRATPAAAPVATPSPATT
jgi:hypothetical protein